MKNKHKYLFFMLGCLASGQVYSMASVRAAAVTAVKKAGKGFVDRTPVGVYLNYKNDKAVIEHFKTKELFLQDAIPSEIKKEATTLFEKHGLHVTCIYRSGPEQNTMPFIAVSSIGSEALLLMNDKFFDLFSEKTKEGFTRDQGLMVLRHELGHALKRHDEKEFLFKSLRLSLRNVAGSTFLYQNVMMASQLGADTFVGHSEMQWGTFTAAVALFCTGKKMSVWLSSLRSRYYERQADHFALKTSDRTQIKSMRDFFDNFRRQVGDPYSWYISSHPRFSERIEACDKAIAELETAKK